VKLVFLKLYLLYSIFLSRRSLFIFIFCKIFPGYLAFLHLSQTCYHKTAISERQKNTSYYVCHISLRHHIYHTMKFLNIRLDHWHSRIHYKSREFITKGEFRLCVKTLTTLRMKRNKTCADLFDSCESRTVRLLFSSPRCCCSASCFLVAISWNVLLAFNLFIFLLISACLLDVAYEDVSFKMDDIFFYVYFL